VGRAVGVDADPSATTPPTTRSRGPSPRSSWPRRAGAGGRAAPSDRPRSPPPAWHGAFTRHGGRSLLAGGRIPLPRERAHQAWWTVPSRWSTHPPPSGTRSPGMVHGRSSREDASSSLGNGFTRRGGRPLLAGGRTRPARERVHPAWCAASPGWRTRLRRSGNALPTHGAKTLLALGCTPFARQDAHLVASSGHPWQEARSPRQVSSTAAKPRRPGSQKRLRLEARQAVTLGTGLIARAVWAPGVASAVLPLFLGAP
jgi:hypothetical protein